MWVCSVCVCDRFVAFIFAMSKVFCSCWALDLFFIRYCNSRKRLLLTFRVLVYGRPTTPCHNMPNISIVFAHLKWQDINTHVCCAELSVHRIVWNWMWCAVLWCDVTMLCISIWCPYAPTVVQHTTHANCMGNIKLLMEDGSITVKWFLLLTQ